MPRSDPPPKSKACKKRGGEGEWVCESGAAAASQARVLLVSVRHLSTNLRASDSQLPKPHSFQHAHTRPARRLGTNKNIFTCSANLMGSGKDASELLALPWAAADARPGPAKNHA